jgi:prepilin peptidase CpaA
LLLPDVLCVLICLVAVVTDLRSRKIPNWLTVPAILGGLVVNAGLPLLAPNPVHGFSVALTASVAGGLLLFLVFGFLGFIRFVGMGDVKLMAAVGVLLRWPTAIWALAYVAIAGGAVAVVYTLVRGRLGAVLGNLLAITRKVVRRKEQREVQLHRIPYALAVFIGATWAAGVKYFPFLAVP